MERADYYALLLTTLLHDVPWKPWVVTGRLKSRDLMVIEYAKRRGYQDLDTLVKSFVETLRQRVKRLKRDDEEAIALISLIIYMLRARGANEAANKLSDVLCNKWSEVREADIIASAIDRFITPQKIDTRYFVNIFLPIFRRELFPQIDDGVESIVEKYLLDIEKVVNAVLNSCKVDDVECILRNLYLTLYTLFETLWHKVSDSRTIPAADTRVPHHTVFDHGRASVTALALRNRALYLRVDIPGVHAFISAGRKTRDFWVGSWLLSLMAWLSIAELVDKLGPHIVLIPALQYNPFYLDMVIQRVKEFQEMIPELLWRDRWPSQPVIPASISMMIDCDTLRKFFEVDECRGVETLIRNRLRERWRDLWKGLRDAVDKWLKNLNNVEKLCDPEGWTETESVYEPVLRLVCLYASSAITHSGTLKYDTRELIRILLEHLLRYLAEATNYPPFDVVVECVEIDYGSDEYREFVKSVEDRLRQIRIVSAGKSAYDMLSEFLKRLDIEIDVHTVLSRTLRFVYAQQKLVEAEKLRLNSTPSYSLKLGKAVAELWSVVKGSGVKARGFRVCSLCGRLPAVARFPRIDESLITVRGIVAIDFNRFRTLQKRIRYLADEGEALCPYCLLRRLLARVPNIASELIESVKTAQRKVIASTTLIANRWHKLIEYAKEEYRDEYMDVPERLIEAIVDRVRGLREDLYNHIVVIYGDGDSMGEGYLRGALLPVTAEDSHLFPYIAKLIEDVEVLRGDSEKFRNRLWSPLLYYWILFTNALGAEPPQEVVEAAKLNAILVAVLSEVVDRSIGYEKSAIPMTIVPSLSYLRTLSSALMITALVDTIIVEKLGGVVVYAGGDDILAMLPPAAESDIGVYEMLSEELLKFLPKAISKSLSSKVLANMLADYIAVEAGNVAGFSIGWIGVVATRLNYWGLLGIEPGFHVYCGIAIPAPVAHGRSYGVNIAHHRRPLWTVFDESYRLMKLKRGLRIDIVDLNTAQLLRRGILKDVAVVGYGAQLYAYTPISLLSVVERVSMDILRLGTEAIKKLVSGLRLVSMLYSSIARGVYTKSLLYDIESIATIMNRLMSVGNAESLHVLRKLIENLFMRNMRMEAIQQAEFANLEILTEEGLRIRVGVGNELYPQILYALRGVRYLLAGMRRGG